MTLTEESPGLRNPAELETIEPEPTTLTSAHPATKMHTMDKCQPRQSTLSSGAVLGSRQEAWPFEAFYLKEGMVPESAISALKQLWPHSSHFLKSRLLTG